MKLDLSPRWITVHHRNRELTARFISMLSFHRHVRFQTDRRGGGGGGGGIEEKKRKEEREREIKKKKV